MDRGFLEGPSTTATAQFGGQGGAKRVPRQGHCEFDGLLFHLTTIFVADRNIWPCHERHFWHRRRTTEVKVCCCYYLTQLPEEGAKCGK